MEVLGELEEAELHARVLGADATHELGLRLGNVERDAVCLRERAQEEESEGGEARSGRPECKPVSTQLCGHDVGDAEGLRE